MVNLSTKTCDCASWQLIGIPCQHAVAAALERNVNIYSLCSREMWAECYKEAIYPTGNEEGWMVPKDINMNVGFTN